MLESGLYNVQKKRIDYIVNFDVLEKLSKTYAKHTVWKSSFVTLQPSAFFVILFDFHEMLLKP